MYLLWAGLSSLLFGFADLAGGIAGRRAPVRLVVVVSQLFGLATIVVVAVALGPADPTGTDLSWGGAAGLVGAAGIVLLYHGLAFGRISVVSPVTAVCSVIVPAAVGLALGERPGAPAWVGAAVALPAIALIASPAPGHDHPSRLPLGGLWWGVGAGAGIGLFLVLIAQPADEAGQWPLVAARVASITIMAAIVTVGREWQGAPVRAAIRPIAAAGILDISANTAFVIAERLGPLSVVAVLAGLYPAATIAGARVLLDERLSVRQGIGLALGAAAVVALSVN